MKKVCSNCGYPEGKHTFSKKCYYKYFTIFCTCKKFKAQSNLLLLMKKKYGKNIRVRSRKGLETQSS